LGGVAAGADRLLSLWLPPSVVSALLLSLLLAFTGAMHLDGFMDSFDGLFGGRNRERRQEIMKDSRVGSYGIAAAGSLLLTEYGCLVALPSGPRLLALIAAISLSRWAMAIVLWAFAPASEKGLAAWLKPGIRACHAVVCTLLAGVIGVCCLGWMGLVALGAAGLVAFLAGCVARSRLGGITGDICGGAGQLVEVVVLVLAVGWTASGGVG